METFTEKLPFHRKMISQYGHLDHVYGHLCATFKRLWWMQQIIRCRLLENTVVNISARESTLPHYLAIIGNGQDDETRIIVRCDMPVQATVHQSRNLIVAENEEVITTDHFLNKKLHFISHRYYLQYIKW